MGLIGAGLATLIASSINVIMFVALLTALGHKGKTNMKISFEEMKLSKPIVILLFSFGASSLLRTVLDNTSIMVLATSVSHLGTNSDSVNSSTAGQALHSSD
jgi:Na+-driven multidrug efflux pump